MTWLGEYYFLLFSPMHSIKLWPCLTPHGFNWPSFNKDLCCVTFLTMSSLVNIYTVVVKLDIIGDFAFVFRNECLLFSRYIKYQAKLFFYTISAPWNWMSIFFSSWCFFLFHSATWNDRVNWTPYRKKDTIWNASLLYYFYNYYPDAAFLFKN